MKRRKPLLNRAPLRGTPKPVRPKKCSNRGCGNPAIRAAGLVAWCSPECGADLAMRAVAKQKAKAAAEERKADKARKDAIKPRSQLLAEAQAAVNKYVRLRDAGRPCISCGRHDVGQWHAGHYRSTAAAPELRFALDNIHAQCAQCNMHLSGNLVLYRAGLIERIGIDRVTSLEGPHPRQKWSREDLLDIRADFKDRVRALLSGRALK